MQIRLGDDPLDMVVELVRDQAFVDQATTPGRQEPRGRHSPGDADPVAGGVACRLSTPSPIRETMPV